MAGAGHGGGAYSPPWGKQIAKRKNTRETKNEQSQAGEKCKAALNRLHEALILHWANEDNDSIYL